MGRNIRKFACDFETTVYENQEYTEVWSAAMVEIGVDNEVIICHSIAEMYNLINNLRENRVILYFHNLKFDGSFWIDYLMRTLKYKQAYLKIKDKYKFMKETEMCRKSFKYSISDKGQWYTIIIKNEKGNIIEIRDSLKLLPFSLEQIGKSFDTEHKKLDMEYEGYRYAGCKISKEEEEYIKNDVLVLKEALEICFNDGHSKLTIGACCLAEYKKIIGKEDYNMFFPDIYNVPISKDLYGYENAGQYIRRSYRGAWTYLVKGKEKRIFKKGLTADVNSLYPSMMHSSSGNKYPVGLPCFWSGNYIPLKAKGENNYYFITIRTSFKIREGYLPTIQIKGDWRYPPRKFLERSAVNYNGKYYEFEKDNEGNIKPITVDLTLTETDYELIKEHYELYNTEILHGCWFYAEIGLFDEYIDLYMGIKANSKGAKRTLAKLFLNNLYGKLSASPDSSFKMCYMDGDDIKFNTVHEEDKIPGYIPCGSAITSYARNFTIRHAQKNYHGTDKPGFIYADTDSIHCDLKKEELTDIEIHPYSLQCWKLESYWDEAIYVRPKTYIEHITHEGEEKCEPHYNITCAGMPDRCKELLKISIEGSQNKKRKKLKYWNKGFLFTENGEPIKRELTDFNIGLTVPGKLMPKRIKGGIILTDSIYTMNKM